MKYKGIIYKIPHIPTTSVPNKVRLKLQRLVAFCLFLSSFDKAKIFLEDEFFCVFDEKVSKKYFNLSFSEIACPASSGIQTILLTRSAKNNVANININNHTRNCPKVLVLSCDDAISSTVYSPAIAPDKASNALSNHA